MHPLRAVPAAVPDLPGAGAGSRFPARAYLPGVAGGRGAVADWRLICHPHGPLPGLPRLRDGVPVGGAVRQDPGASPGGDRVNVSASLAGTAAEAVVLHPRAARPQGAGALGMVAADLPAVRIADAGARQRRAQAAGIGESGSAGAARWTENFSFRRWAGCTTARGKSAAGCCFTWGVSPALPFPS